MLFRSTKVNATAITNTGLNGGTTLPLNSGDFIDLRVFQNSGGAINTINASEQNWIAIKREY